MTKICSVCLLLVAFAVFPSSRLLADEFREFTNSEGKKITAKPVSIADGKVVLEMKGRKTYKFPLEKLSDADREFLTKWKKSNPQVSLDLRLAKT